MNIKRIYYKIKFLIKKKLIALLIGNDLENQYPTSAMNVPRGIRNLPKPVQVSMTNHRHSRDEINKAFALAREQLKQRQDSLKSFERKSKK